jgi:UDP-N-acetylmuramoylalanine-D-glutamate ligase
MNFGAMKEINQAVLEAWMNLAFDHMDFHGRVESRKSRAFKIFDHEAAFKSGEKKL